MSFFNINTEADLKQERTWLEKRISRVISVEEALEKVLSSIQYSGSRRSPILESLGQVLAEDIYCEYRCAAQR